MTTHCLAYTGCTGLPLELRQLIDSFLYFSPDYLVGTLVQLKYNALHEAGTVKEILRASHITLVHDTEIVTVLHTLMTVHWDARHSITIRLYDQGDKGPYWALKTSFFGKREANHGYGHMDSLTVTQEFSGTVIKLLPRKGKPPSKKAFPTDYVVAYDGASESSDVGVRPPLRPAVLKRRKPPKKPKKRRTELEDLGTGNLSLKRLRSS